MLHYHVEVVVGDEVFEYANCALLRLAEVLERHGPLDLHHDALLEVWAALSEVLELLDEEEGLREFILRHVGFDGRQ